MLQCGIVDGIDINCADLRKPGGLYRIVWVFNKEALRVPIDVTIADYITDLEFLTYMSLYKFESVKYAFQATWKQQGGVGQTVSFLQTVALSLPNSNPASDKVIEDASVSELGVITRSNAGEYQIWGAENGLASDDSTTGGSGKASTDSTFTTLNLSGVERYLPKRLLIHGSDANTLAYLNAATV